MLKMLKKPIAGGEVENETGIGTEKEFEKSS